MQLHACSLFQLSVSSQLYGFMDGEITHDVSRRRPDMYQIELCIVSIVGLRMYQIQLRLVFIVGLSL